MKAELADCTDAAAALEQYIKAKTGARRPRLEDVTIAQWGLANIRIMDKLFQSTISGARLYMAYTAKVFQMFGKFDRVKVLHYDRQYRTMQAASGFQWGTDLPHLDTIAFTPGTMLDSTLTSPHMQQNSPYMQQNKFPGAQKGNNVKRDIVCKMFNRLSGCKFGTRCNFQHLCSNCQGAHPAFAHTDEDGSKAAIASQPSRK
jgi:hypothetical protein